MPRIRTVKPEFWDSEDMAVVSEPSCLLAIGLLNFADDEGFFNANEAIIKKNIFPLREPSMTIHEQLNELSNIGYLSLHNGEKNRSYGHIKNFNLHQKINRPNPSKIKGLITDDVSSLNTHGAFTAGKERKGKEQGKEGNNKTQATRIEKTWIPSEGVIVLIAESENVPIEWVHKQNKLFALHWSGSGEAKALKLNWDNAFEFWCSTARDKPAPKQDNKTPDETVMWKRRLIKFSDKGIWHETGRYSYKTPNPIIDRKINPDCAAPRELIAEVFKIDLDIKEVA